MTQPRPQAQVPPTPRPTLPRASPETHRSLPVAPLIGDKRCYGEAPVCLRWGNGDMLGWQGTMFPAFHPKRRMINVNAMEGRA